MCWCVFSVCVLVRICVSVCVKRGGVVREKRERKIEGERRKRESTQKRCYQCIVGHTISVAFGYFVASKMKLL